MRKNNHAAPLWVSQNFLTARAAIRRIVRLAKLNPGDHVIEIGAGKGHITRALAAVCASVSAYEIDSTLAARLCDTFRGTNVRIHCRDFLAAPLPQNTPYKVFSNIPFSRTSEIISKLSQAKAPPDEAWLVMEKGAAKRFLGRPVESRASLMLKPFFDIQIRYHFRREDFHPAPSVDTVLICLRRKPVPDLPLTQRRAYSAFIQKHYSASRDTLYIQWLCLFRKKFGKSI